MDDLEKSILDAWARIAPGLDPSEIGRRLARHPKQPPRAWCLAIRASDARLPKPPSPYVPCPDPQDREFRHQVILNREMIHDLCSPVILPAPGQTIDEVTAKLGVGRGSLLVARLKGVLQTHYVPGLGGYWGKPRPVLRSNQPLDPAARNFASPDPLWSWTAEYLFARIPSDRPPQKLIRVAHFRPLGPDYQQIGHVHPEHPDRDPPPRRERSYRLPPPLRDYVSYKWDGDEYVGFDSRNPATEANYERAQKRLALARAAARSRRRNHPPPSKSRGSLLFNGWRWLCSRCSRIVRMLYLPLPPINLLQTHLSLRAVIPPCFGASNQFACERCHRLRRVSRCDPNVWNEIICHLTGGLLYGREVPRPAWFDPQRQIQYTPRPNRAPSRRTQQVEAQLLAGKTFRQIALQLGIAYGTVLFYAQQVYRQHGARALAEFLGKNGRSIPLKKRHEIHQRLGAGESVAHIAEQMQISCMSVYNHIYMLRRSGLIPPIPRRRGITPLERNQIRLRIADGQSNQQIAADLGVTARSIYHQRWIMGKKDIASPEILHS